MIECPSRLVAERTGYSQREVQRWLAGDVRPSRLALKRLHEAGIMLRPDLSPRSKRRKRRR
jgi:transcriptional regulator with XRE-family HTH domain